MTDEQQKGPPEEGDGRVSELEATVADLAARLAEREQGLAAQAEVLQSAQAESSALKERLGHAVARFREVLLAGATAVPEELVTGQTIEELEASLASGKELVERVKRQLASGAAERVPAGAPARSGLDVSGLSPREKIAYALGRA